MKLFRIVVLVLVASLLGCKKYEQGPMISFRSKKARIVGNWSLAYARMYDPTAERLYTNDQNVYEDSLLVQQYEFTSNNEFKVSESGVTKLSGIKWELDSDKENIVLNRINGLIQIMPIQKLFKNEMKLDWKVNDTIRVEMSFNR